LHYFCNGKVCLFVNKSVKYVDIKIKVKGIQVPITLENISKLFTMMLFLIFILSGVEIPVSL